MKIKLDIPLSAYKGKNRGYFSELADAGEEGSAFVYFEIAPGQFVEFFPKKKEQMPHGEWNDRADYSHFALLVDNIYETRKELESRGVVFDTEISIGPTGTYKMWMHDPDGNRFEIMQYTKDSVQLQ